MKSVGDRNATLDEHIAAIRRLGKQTAANIVEIGQHLAECKDLVGHRNFGCWLDKEFGWSERTAQRFMSVHELAGKSDNLSDLDLPVSAFYLLAAPSTPEPVRDEILERSKAGERITHQEVKGEIARAKAVKTPPTAEPSVVAPLVQVECLSQQDEVEPLTVQMQLVHETENDELKHEIRRLKLAHEDEAKHLKVQIEHLALQVAADRHLTLQAAIEQLIEQANRTTCFENVLPEDVVFRAKDLDRVINHLRSLNASMAKRRKAVKSKKPPAVAVVDDGIPENPRRPPAMPDPESTPDVNIPDSHKTVH